MDETRLKRLRYRAWHRGFREADLILGPFVDRHGAELSAVQMTDLETLLDQPDQDLYAWIVGQTPTPEAFDTEVMGLIQGFRYFAHAALGPGEGG